MSDSHHGGYNSFVRSGNRDSLSSRRSAGSTAYNGGGGHYKASSASASPATSSAAVQTTLRNSSPAAKSKSLSDEVSRLNLQNGDDIPIGSVVQCTLEKSARVYKGEVMAIDLKAIILKCAASCQRSSLNDIHIFNRGQVKELKLVHENKDAVPDLPNVNVERLENKLIEQIKRKKRLLVAFKPGIAPEGQKLFQTISKTIDEVVWAGENIEVMHEVTITPPYRPDNVRGNMESKALKHVRKIVEKHINDQMMLKQHQHQQPIQPTDCNTGHDNSPSSSCPTLGGNAAPSHSGTVSTSASSGSIGSAHNAPQSVSPGQHHHHHHHHSQQQQHHSHHYHAHHHSQHQHRLASASGGAGSAGSNAATLASSSSSSSARSSEDTGPAAVSVSKPPGIANNRPPRPAGGPMGRPSKSYNQ